MNEMIFPSTLLIMITYPTTLLMPLFFEAVLSVNLTTMLVMTTIFISKMESLPPTSNLQIIDAIACLIIRQLLRERELWKSKDRGKRGLNCPRMIITSFYWIFLVSLSFCFAFMSLRVRLLFLEKRELPAIIVATTATYIWFAVMFYYIIVWYLFATWKK